MKKNLIRILVLTLAAGLLLVMNTACKKTADTTELTLTVSVGEGIDGTPVSGSYTHNENDTVDYDYTLKDKYMNLKVFFDGAEIPRTGTITITGNHSLSATSEPEPGDHLLSVALSQGIDGTPERGNYFYNTGESLDYSYTLQDEFTNLRVTLDGDDVPASGTIVFTEAHTLLVLADRYFEIRGTWRLQEFYEDNSTFIVTLTFSGDEGTSGTVVDSDGGTGTYTVSGPSVSFTIEYPDVVYEYTGTFTAEDNMQGNSDRITTSNTYPGLWSAARESAATTSSRKTRQGKGKAENDRFKDK
ncbi:MAG: hypothetical protein GY940_29250 [bacterium]|nr:hypothetical protein [bacterium]